MECATTRQIERASAPQGDSHRTTAQDGREWLRQHGPRPAPSTRSVSELREELEQEEKAAGQVLP